MPAGQITGLLQRARSGDEEAIQELRILSESLIARYAAGDRGKEVAAELNEYIEFKCKWWVEQQVKDSILVKDVMQEIRLKIFSSLGKGGFIIQEGSDFGRFVRVIAKNEVMNFFRDKKKRGQNPTSEIEVEDPSNPEDELLTNDLQERFKKAIQELSELCQKILMVYVLMHWSDKEISNSLDMPIEELYWRKSRCLKQLRKKLPPQADFV
jgi:RNA polymerase sigma factor (sigma-70 family)